MFAYVAFEEKSVEGSSERKQELACYIISNDNLERKLMDMAFLMDFEKSYPNVSVMLVDADKGLETFNMIPPKNVKDIPLKDWDFLNFAENLKLEERLRALFLIHQHHPNFDFDVDFYEMDFNVEFNDWLLFEFPKISPTDDKIQINTLDFLLWYAQKSIAIPHAESEYHNEEVSLLALCEREADSRFDIDLSQIIEIKQSDLNKLFKLPSFKTALKIDDKKIQKVHYFNFSQVKSALNAMEDNQKSLLENISVLFHIFNDKIDSNRLFDGLTGKEQIIGITTQYRLIRHLNRVRSKMSKNSGTHARYILEILSHYYQERYTNIKSFDLLFATFYGNAPPTAFDTNHTKAKMSGSQSTNKPKKVGGR